MDKYNESLLDLLSALIFMVESKEVDAVQETLDEKTNRIIKVLEYDLDYQNVLLKKILSKLEEKE